MSFKDDGFTQIPNLVLNNPAVPRCVRGTYEAISARAFGKRFSIFVSEDTLAKDVGVSPRTIIRHLNVLEALHLIQRIRLGKGLTNTIILTLKVSNPDSLTQSIRKGKNSLHEAICEKRKLTMRDCLELSGKQKKRKKEARAFQSYAYHQALEILREKRK